MKQHKLFAFVTVLVLVAILAACAPPPTPEKVVETITVVETVVVQGETVVQEKVITATPEPTKPPMDKITFASTGRTTASMAPSSTAWSRAATSNRIST